MSIDLIARTVRGIEYVAADELTELTPESLVMQPRQVVLRLAAPDPRLLGLRTVDDLFLSVGSVAGVDHRKDAVRRLARGLADLDWRQAVDVLGAVRPIPSHRRFDVVASLLGRRNYNRYDVEDAAGGALAGVLSAEYVSRRDRADSMPPTDLTVRVFADSSVVRLALRYADGPLHRRSYKQDTARGTLHPPMAAALARLIDARDGETVLDPFCGDGTIPIEVAAYAPAARIRGTDLDPERVRNATENARRAGAQVSFSAADAVALAGPIDVLATNPPWNLAVEASGQLAGGLKPFWTAADRALGPNARLGLIMAADLDPAKTLESRGYRLTLVQAVRLAGRMSQLVIAARDGWRLPTSLDVRRRRAQADGLITETGFG